MQNLGSSLMCLTVAKLKAAFETLVKDFKFHAGKRCSVFPGCACLSSFFSLVALEQPEIRGSIESQTLIPAVLGGARKQLKANCMGNAMGPASVPGKSRAARTLFHNSFLAFTALIQ